ncbi:hypothetical protein QYF36_018641 [Acer negundo]|nr:hypothetical protein QYF36_006442 [Acer negundo]KAK4834194.1 hypothetical protein QYF36_018641 [Acer negundo]
MMGMMSWEVGAAEQGWRKGPWTPEEDKLLNEYVNLHGEGRWSSVARSAGLNRSGKSCRLRWVNYLRPGLKRGQITPQEEGIIIELHALWGNKWSTIARYLPGRTDNEIKNYWRTHFKKREKSSHKQEKRKAQLLKQKQQQENMSRVSSHADTDKLLKVIDQGNPENQQNITVTMHPSTSTVEDHYSPIMYHHDNNIIASNWSSDQYCVVDEGLWGGLWNLDDHPQNDHVDTNGINKILTMQNQATGFPFGGDSNNFYNTGGYIF